MAQGIIPVYQYIYKVYLYNKSTRNGNHCKNIFHSLSSEIGIDVEKSGG